MNILYAATSKEFNKWPQTEYEGKYYLAYDIIYCAERNFSAAEYENDDC